MAEFDLLRIARHQDGAFGVLLQDGLPFALTLERTYDDLSVKIPVGEYHARKSYFWRGGYNTYEIPVDGHSRLLFHRGNTEMHSDGCILVGEEFGFLDGKPAVLSSAKGFVEFMRRTRSKPEITISVREVL